MNNTEAGSSIAAVDSSTPLKRALWIAAYAAAALAPALVALILNTDPDNPPLFRIGQMFGLVGLAALALQPLLAARLRVLDRAFGLDAVLRFHRLMAIFLTIIVVGHPFFLAAAHGNLLFPLTHFKSPWPIMLGKFALIAIAGIMVTSLMMGKLRLRYEHWRFLHNALAIAILGMGAVHSVVVGGDLEHWPVRAVWIALLLIAAASYGCHTLIGPLLRRAKPFTVTEVKQETHNVWTLKLTPAEGAGPLQYRPGQFQFLKFIGTEGLPSEEHPFTISSSPSASGVHSATIKESGDFTGMIGRVRPGDKVAVQGPFGRFSCALHPQERNLVFIAGGIGVTPFIAMLRALRDERADVSVLLLYANRTEKDIAFREEIDAVCAAAPQRMKVVHVLSDPQPAWGGDKGFIGIETIRRHVGALTPDKVFYVCGPPPMMKGIIRGLREAGVPRRNVRSERFSL